MERARSDIRLACSSIREPFSFGKTATLALGVRGRLYCDTMQAGDKLDFIRPFDVLQPTTEVSDKESQERTLAFAAIMRQLVFDCPERVESFEVFEESGFVTVFEASYRLNMQDGSYLHIVGFGHQDDEGLLDAGVSVIEHTDDGLYRGGYVYTFNVDGVRRTTAYPDDDNSEMTDEDRRTHFSVADLYQGRNELDDMRLSDDTDEVLAALAMDAQLEEDALMGRLAAEMGADDQLPHQGELEQLADLIKDAYHFPLTR